MPFPEDFEKQCLYRPDAWFVHDVLELDPEQSRVVGLIDTTRLGPLVDAQRTWPGHAKHFPGAIAIQVTGTLGQLHATYCMGLKATEGWFGFGTHIKKARFPAMGEIGPPVHARIQATRQRKLRGVWFVDYDFRYTQGDKVIYESTQTAAWARSEHRGPLGD